MEPIESAAGASHSRWSAKPCPDGLLAQNRWAWSVQVQRLSPRRCSRAAALSARRISAATPWALGRAGQCEDLLDAAGEVAIALTATGINASGRHLGCRGRAAIDASRPE